MLRRTRIALIGLYACGLALLCSYVPWTAVGVGMDGVSPNPVYFGHTWLWRRPNVYAVIETSMLLDSIVLLTAFFVFALCFTLLNRRIKN